MSYCQPWDRKGHGTEARYKRHRREGEPACPACLEAAAREAVRRKQERRARQTQERAA